MLQRSTVPRRCPRDTAASSCRATASPSRRSRRPSCWWARRCSTRARRASSSSASRSSGAPSRGSGHTLSHSVSHSFLKYVDQFSFTQPSKLAGKRACRFPGNPPHGRVAPVKFLYEIGDRIIVQVCNFFCSDWATYEHEYPATCHPSHKLTYYFRPQCRSGFHSPSSSARGRQPRLQCLESGRWSGRVPRCTSYASGGSLQMP